MSVREKCDEKSWVERGGSGASQIPTLNFAKNAEFRMAHPAWRARLSLDDPRHQALPAGLRSGAENRNIRPGAVRSDDGAIPALGSQSVAVDVRIPAAI